MMVIMMGDGKRENTISYTHTHVLQMHVTTYGCSYVSGDKVILLEYTTLRAQQLHQTTQIKHINKNIYTPNTNELN